MMSGFIAESTAMPFFASTPVSTYDHFTHWLSKGVLFLVPDFSGTSPVDFLVDGAYIPWRLVGGEASIGAGAHTLLALAVGCLIFWRRELARIQV
jgi:hypothetical protein